MDKYLKRKKIYVPQAQQQSGGSAPSSLDSTPPPVLGANQSNKLDDSASKKPKQEELEVTGVSRSGRVRKKSSKLTDFESPDEIDPRYKRKVDRLSTANEVEVPKKKNTPATTPKTSKGLAPPVPLISPTMDSDAEELDEEEESYTHGMKTEFDSDTEAALMLVQGDNQEEDSSDAPESHDEGVTAESGDDLDDDDSDDDEGQLVMVDDPKPSRPSNQAMSLYMLEKSTKKRLVVKDGKIIGRKKAQRKDKGKSRFTAYMLWAKEARKDIVKSNPDMDFATTSKRLGELWSIVPNSEKFTWRRRAKRLSVKQKADEIKSAANPTNSSKNKFINKTPATSKLTSPPRQRQERRSSQNSQSQQQQLHQQQGELGTLAAAAAVAQQQQLLQQQQLQNALAAAATDVNWCTENGGSASRVKSDVAQTASAMFKPVATSPLDVAAHLKLLGESLLIIGERLKEHEGQIAVSGSFSVLLDSLLCAMAPLLCLTQQIPQMNGCAPETLSQTLDNIAYIMPGL